MLRDLLLYPLYRFIGYLFMYFKYREEETRKQILIDKYDNSYALAGRIITGQFIIAILIIVIRSALLVFILRSGYDQIYKPLFG